MKPSFSIVPRATEVRRRVIVFFKNHFNQAIAAEQILKSLDKALASYDHVLDPAMTVSEVEAVLDDMYHDNNLAMQYREGVKHYYITPTLFKGTPK